jgi:hypothetical protein
MKRRGKLSWFMLILLLVGAVPANSGAQSQAEYQADGAILVGRLSYLEGEVFRFVPEDDDWVPALEDTPFGVDDALYSEEDGRAEIILPNGIWMRIGSRTRIDLIGLRSDLTKVYMTSGTARVYGRGSDLALSVETPFGSVMATGETAFDLYVDGDSLEIVPLQGTLSFIHGSTGKEYELIPNSTSIIADDLTVSTGDGYGDPDWEAWNRDRDSFWATRMSANGASATYLPPSIDDQAYDLEENGVWEDVSYDGGHYTFWRPMYVGPGWSPFTVGYWAPWRGEWTWIPCEPFGYVTHHYGNWIFTRGRWYWAPPVALLRAYLRPGLFYVPFAWYPGRVAWIWSGLYAGWIPLGPSEPYYCHHRWGPHVVIVKNASVINAAPAVTRYKNYRHAVIIDRRDLHRMDNYRNRTIRVSQSSIINAYHVSPLPLGLDRDFHWDNGRRGSTKPNLKMTPQPPAFEKPRAYQAVRGDGASVAVTRLREKARSIRSGPVERKAAVVSPRARARLPEPRVIDKRDLGRPHEARAMDREETPTVERAQPVPRETEQRAIWMVPRPAPRSAGGEEGQRAIKREGGVRGQGTPPLPGGSKASIVGHRQVSSGRMVGKPASRVIQGPPLGQTRGWVGRNLPSR